MSRLSYHHQQHNHHDPPRLWTHIHIYSPPKNKQTNKKITHNTHKYANRPDPSQGFYPNTRRFLSIPIETQCCQASGICGEQYQARISFFDLFYDVASALRCAGRKWTLFHLNVIRKDGGVWVM